MSSAAKTEPKLPVRLLMILGGLVTFAVIVFVSFNWSSGPREYFVEPEKLESAEHQNSGATSNGASFGTGSSLIDKSETSWDSIQTEIDAFEKDLAPSEVDASKLWPTSLERQPP